MTTFDAPAEHDDLGILLAMIFAAWADGRITHDEIQLVREEIADQGLDQLELSIAREALLEPPTAERVARLFTTDDARMAGLLAAHITVLSDANLAFDEIRALSDLGDAMGLGEEAQAEVRQFAEREAGLIRAKDWEGTLLLERMDDLLK